MAHVQEAQTGVVSQKHILVMLCFALILLSYFAVSNYVERKSETLKSNAHIKNQVTLLLRDKSTVSDAIKSLGALDKEIGRMPDLQPKVRTSLQNQVEAIETQLLQEQQLMVYIQDRLNALRPEVAANDIGLISAAYAATPASTDSAAEDATLRERLVEGAFLLLTVVFGFAAWSAFNAQDAARASFAQDVLKIEIGFLTGLVSAVFTH
jgi:hypothetical protein